jgi:hypothetical protein
MPVVGTLVAHQRDRRSGVKRTIVGGIFFVGVLLTSVVAGGARDVVELRLYGHYFAEPATVRITVAVEPDAENRMLRIEADGDEMYRASEIELSGADEKRLHSLEFKNLKAGNYTLRAEVHSATALRGMAEQEVVVTGSGGRDN